MNHLYYIVIPLNTPFLGLVKTREYSENDGIYLEWQYLARVRKGRYCCVTNIFNPPEFLKKGLVKFKKCTFNAVDTQNIA